MGLFKTASVSASEPRLSLDLIAPFLPGELCWKVLSYLETPTSALIKELTFRPFEDRWKARRMLLTFSNNPDCDFDPLQDPSCSNEPACYFVPKKAENVAGKRIYADRLRENPGGQNFLLFVDISAWCMRLWQPPQGCFWKGSSRRPPQCCFWDGESRHRWIEDEFRDRSEEFWERYWDEWLLKKYQALW